MGIKITIRISDGMKAEIERLVDEIGIWHNQSHFVKDALDEYIKKHWQGERFDNKY
jgi:Arc/MetJ-type ribon-helix-helix transcriptional regulator